MGVMVVGVVGFEFTAGLGLELGLESGLESGASWSYCWLVGVRI